MRISIRVLAGAATVLAMSIALPAVSQPASQGLALDSSAPMEIGADGGGGFNAAACTTSLNGNAQVTQGRARIVGRTIVAYHRRQGGSCGDVDRIEVDKDVFYITPDGTVRADHAVYDVTTSTAVFTGQVVVVRGQDVATGSKLTINTKTNDTTMEGPVRGLITPPAKPAA
jgi:lipopolysaccharide export system protein LptA